MYSELEATRTLQLGGEGKEKVDSKLMIETGEEREDPELSQNWWTRRGDLPGGQRYDKRLEFTLKEEEVEEVVAVGVELG